MISCGEFFRAVLKHTSIRVEVDDLGLADLGVQVVTCERMKTDLAEGILESLCDSWRETLGRRQQRDMGRVLSDSLGARPALGGDAGLSESDARVLPDQRDETTSERWRDWKSLSGVISDPFFPDWPLEGPRTTKWLVKEIAKSGGSPLQHHQRWKTQFRADDGDRSVHEHELLCMTLELSGCNDQLDLSALAGIELVARHLQLIEESKAAGDSATYEGAKFFVDYRRSGAMVAPELERHVAEQAPGGGQRYEGEAQTCQRARFGPCNARERREDRMTLTSDGSRPSPLSQVNWMACTNSSIAALAREGCSLFLVRTT